MVNQDGTPMPGRRAASARATDHGNEPMTGAELLDQGRAALDTAHQLLAAWRDGAADPDAPAPPVP